MDSNLAIKKIDTDNLVSFRGVIKSISTKTAVNGKTFFSLDSAYPNLPRQADNTILCRAFRTGLVENMPVEVEGIWDNEGLNCTQCNFVWISDKATIDYYVALTKSKHTRFGLKKIEKIVETYGKRIIKMSQMELLDALLTDFPSWGQDTIDRFIRAVFETNSSLIELEQFLSIYKTRYQHVEYKTILAIHETYGIDAVRFIKENPYKIGLQFEIPRDIVDQIAFDTKVKALSSNRINGLIEYYLMQQSNDGHTYVNTYDIAHNVNQYSESSLYMESIPAICISDAIFHNPKLYLDIEAGTVALKRLHNAEINIATRLKRLAATKSIIQVNANGITDIENQFNVIYGHDQRKAFYLLEDGGISILTGGPGTGKTSTIKGIVKYYKKYYPNAVISFVAPTGRAAKRLTESLDGEYKAKTIHKLVNYQPFESGNIAEYNAINPLPADFIIVDEVSMVDTLMLEMLLLAAKDTCRILFVGDEFQLPSVGAGNCLHDMIASKQFPVYRLIENFRQKGAGTIVDNANQILKGEMPIANETDFCITACETDEESLRVVKELITKLYDVNDPFKTQIIQPSKKRETGTYAINDFVHRMIVHQDINTSSDIQVGDKIMFIRNQYQEGCDPLYVNGELGIVESIDDYEITINDGCGKDAETKLLPHSALHDMILAYSYTIHKSQGSENPIIIIYLPQTASNMMYRSLLYTAVTRAQRAVHIVYTGSALQKCINNTDNAKRNTRLRERLVA